MIEADKIKIISGRYAGEYGKIQIKTSNGWYHVKIKRLDSLVKLRLGDIIPSNKHGLTRGQVEGIKKDRIFNKKMKGAKIRSSQRKEDIKTVTNLIHSGSSNKTLKFAVIKARQNKISSDDYKLLKLGKTKKTRKKRLETIHERV